MVIRPKIKGMLNAGALSLLLGGCFQAQLNGPVAGAQITVSELRDSSVIHVQRPGATADSVIAEKGQDEWDSFGELVRLLHFGVVTDKLPDPPANRLYLISAFGGADHDWNMDRKTDAKPVAVSGQWHAIVPGAVINNPEIKVSALTEAVYQWIAPGLQQLTDAELLDALNRAATQLVGDVDEDGTVDYTDLLEWSRLLTADNDLLRADPDVLRQLAANIKNNGSLERRRELAVAMINEPSPGLLSTEEHFSTFIAADVLEARCLACHVEDGVADNGGARLIFDARGTAAADAANIEEFQRFIDDIDGGDELILSKVQGVGHGGGAVFGSFTDEFANLDTFISLLQGGNGGAGSGAQVAQFWQGVTLAGSTRTLRRAALVLAGRLPTEAEYTRAKRGEQALRRTVLGLMEGEGFRDFLVRGANDRLHLEAFQNGLAPDFLDPGIWPKWTDKILEIYARSPPSDGNFPQEHWDWEQRVVLGVSRAPLELIAHIVMNDQPYSEVLTANYTMVNPFTNYIFRSQASFDDQTDPFEFKPGPYRGQIFQDEHWVIEDYVYPGVTYQKTLSHSGWVSLPPAGILNEPAFLHRYPTTETNRNRARARWTYLHFLGIDIEKSASRTTDPDALADTNNPTMNNPACTVCHVRMDPVAGAYQNYDEWGSYRRNSRDALPDTYKYPEWFDENASLSPYREGDTWFRDMRNPGFEGSRAPSKDNSLAWLGKQITEDPRFASATAAFWWPSLMGAETLRAPEAREDPTYDAQLRAFEAQQASIAEMGEAFIDRNLNLRQLLADMVMSPWFRASAVDPAIAEERAVELRGVGINRLLTPEELEAKNQAIFGRTWGEWPSEWELDGEHSELLDNYRIYYGGIDSFGIKERSRQMTALMSNVAAKQSIEMACSVAALDLAQPAADRRIFTRVDKYTTPVKEMGRTFKVSNFGTYADRKSYKVSGQIAAGDRALRLTFNNDAYNEATQEDRNLYIDKVEIRRNGETIKTIQGEKFREQRGFNEAEGIDENGNRYVQGDVYYDDVNGQWKEVGWQIWCIGYVEFQVQIPRNARYDIVVNAWGTHAGERIPPEMTVSVSANNAFVDTQGSRAVRQQLVDLHSLMLGQDYPTDHPEIEAAYRLLAARWRERRDAAGNNGNSWDWEVENCRVDARLNNRQWEAVNSDPEQMVNTWASVIQYLMTHFDYLHE